MSERSVEYERHRERRAVTVMFHTPWGQCTPTERQTIRLWLLRAVDRLQPYNDPPPELEEYILYTAPS